MNNSQKGPNDDGSNSAILESVSLKNQKERTEIADGNTTRKYHLSNIFRNMVCCSCFSNENKKYTAKKTDKDAQKLTSFEEKKMEKTVEPDEVESPKGTEIVSNNENNAELGSSSFSNKKIDQPSISTDTYAKEFESIDNDLKLLPQVLEKHKNKKCFVIDLDETLVHSSYGYVKAADIQVTVDIDGVQQKVYVCKRPFVDEFIAEVGELFECILFTASLGKYADPVTDFLDPSGTVFAARLFREACTFREGNYVKDLDGLGRPIDQVFILDNSPVSYWQHPRNAIQIVSWFDESSDTALRDLLPYLRELAAAGPESSVSDYLELHEPPESVGLFGHPPSSLHWLLAQYHSVPLARSIFHQQQQHHIQHGGMMDDDEEEEDNGHEGVSMASSSHSSRDVDLHQEATPGIIITPAASAAVPLPGQPRPPPPPVSGADSFITQALKDFRRKSQAALDDELHRPPVSSPVARPKSEFHLTDDDASSHHSRASLH